MTSARSQQVKEHQVWADLNNLDHLLATAESLLPSEDPGVGEAYVSLLALAKHTRTVLKSMNTLIVPLPQLNDVDSAIQSISSSVAAANTQEDDTQLLTAWTQTDDLLAVLAPLPVVKSRHDVVAVMEAMAQFQQQISNALEELQQQAEQVSTEVGAVGTRQGALSNEIAEQKTSAAQTISEFETKMATATEAFETQLASVQATQESQNEAAFAEVHEKLTAVEDKADEFYELQEERHSEQTGEFRTKFDAAQAERDRRANATAEAYATRANEIIAKLQAEFEEGKKLVGMIGNVTMTGHYQENAKEQKEEADRWRKWTVIVTSVTVAWAIGLAVYGLFSHEDRDWLDYVTRIAVTVALAALAGYLGIQARIHRTLETRYRSLGLELATFDPFLNTMTDAERNNIKTQLATRYFVGVDPKAPLLEALEEEPSTGI